MGRHCSSKMGFALNATRDALKYRQSNDDGTITIMPFLESIQIQKALDKIERIKVSGDRNRSECSRNSDTENCQPSIF